jgi:hypothetical protein
MSAGDGDLRTKRIDHREQFPELRAHAAPSSR